MSRLFIFREATISTPRVPSVWAVKNTHVTLANADLDDNQQTIETLARIVQNAPDSTKNSLSVDAERIGRVGPRLMSASLALMLLEDETLRDELNYYSQTLGIKPVRRPHITLAKDIPHDKVDAVHDRLNQKVDAEQLHEIKLEPVRFMLRMPHTPTNKQVLPTEKPLDWGTPINDTA